MKDYWLYVLDLEGGRFYIGITTNLKRRYKRHTSGQGANFTRAYKPIRIRESFYLGVVSEAEALTFEDARALEYILKHGVQRARGGSFFRTYESVEYFERRYGSIPARYKELRHASSPKYPTAPRRYRAKAMSKKQIRKAANRKLMKEFRARKARMKNEPFISSSKHEPPLHVTHADDLAVMRERRATSRRKPAPA